MPTFVSELKGARVIEPDSTLVAQSRSKPLRLQVIVRGNQLPQCTHAQMCSPYLEAGLSTESSEWQLKE